MALATAVANAPKRSLFTKASKFIPAMQEISTPGSAGDDTQAAACPLHAEALALELDRVFTLFERLPPHLDQSVAKRHGGNLTPAGRKRSIRRGDLPKVLKDQSLSF